jgi:hypothetical protein
MQPATRETDPRAAAAIETIRTDGYARLPGEYGAAEIATLRGEIARLESRAADEASAALPRLDRGQQTIYNLQNKSADCLHLLLGSATVRTVLMAFLNDEWHRAIPLTDPNYVLRSFSARNNRVAAPLHIDSFIPYVGEHALSMQVAIIVDPQTTDNGCTVVIPGSHQSGAYVSQSERARQVPIDSEPGDVVLWDSRIWHGTLDNTSGQPRWSLIATFVRWWVKQGYRIPENLPQAIYESLDDSGKAVLGYCALPFDDERGGADFKQGYASLRPRVADYREGR